MRAKQDRDPVAHLPRAADPHPRRRRDGRPGRRRRDAADVAAARATAPAAPSTSTSTTRSASPPPPADARTSVYSTDVAKTIQAPIFHVNGDDPEAVVRVAELAFEYRQEFHRDVVIDLVCYRRRGHNEGDDPSMTQPLMYNLIEAKRCVRRLYTEALVGRGDITQEEYEQAHRDFQDAPRARLRRDARRADRPRADRSRRADADSDRSPTSSCPPRSSDDGRGEPETTASTRAGHPAHRRRVQQPARRASPCTRSCSSC